MLDYKKAALLFEDRAESGDYFDSASAELSRTTLRSLICEDERKLLFLLGDPGVGKSHMLETVAEEMKGERLIVHLKEPFFEPKEFLERLLREAGEPTGGEIDGMKRAAVDIYGQREHLVMIDEAQLLDEKSLELLRILADTKAFRLLLSMHKREGEEILARPHFRTRSHRVVEIGELSEDEVRRYIESRLGKSGLGDISGMFGPRHYKRIYRYSGGNFRTVKRMMQTLFELMRHAKENGLSKYSVPSDCTLDMAALDLELIDA
ncbi:transformation system protein [Hydrogenimonas sp.]|nr:transformation system protein [Hydrogenimonas sp.]